jgi:cell division topological specificity factor
MSSVFDRILGKRTSSASTARERLQLVLIHDRTDISSEVVEKIRQEISAVISKYIEINPRDVKVTLIRSGREQSLNAAIPLRPVNPRR